ncbi:MAG: FAD-binding oxidoreductase [Chloroflexi bacterium]|nr:FAD-binding oxidoreductase [Chloroflexota bacterium]
MTVANRKDTKGTTVVIGAGILGASIAFHLSLRGERVVLLDASEPGQGASSVSFAWMNGHNKTPQHYHDLNRRSLDMWDRFARQLGGDVGLVWGGQLRWASTAQGANDLVRRVQQMQTWGYPIRSCDNSELISLEPRLSFDKVTAASFTAIEGHVDTEKVIGACIRNAGAMGAQVRAHTKVQRLDLRETGKNGVAISTVGTTHGDIPCDRVVIAAGPDTAEIAAYAGVEVPLNHTFGASIITESIPPLFDIIAVLHTCTDYKPQMALRQLDDGSVMIHGGLHGGANDRSLGKDEAEISEVLSHARQIAPALEGVAIKEVRRGRRPIPADGHPILGYTESIPNLYLAVTHSGVTLAPLVGELAAMEISDGAGIGMLEPFRLERFG